MGGVGNEGGTGMRAQIDDLLDRPEAAPPPRSMRADPQEEAPPTGRTPVQLRVVWGDLCRVEAEVHAVGHYQGVMPTSAEAALDAAISGEDESRRIIAEHTRRQWILGDFGHVNYFPSTNHEVVKLAAVAGMGRPGTFTEARGRRLYENLLVELCALGSAKRVATVAIGSGAGNLSFDQTARAITSGFAAALRSSRMMHPCTSIDIVEFDRLRAERLLIACRMVVASHTEWLTLSDELEVGGNGRVGFASAMVYALGALAGAGPGEDPRSEGLESPLAALGGASLPELVRKRLKEADPAMLLGSADVTVEHAKGKGTVAPVRISVLHTGNRRSLRVAAITGMATVPERQIDADPRLIDEIVRRMNPPGPADLAWLPDLMSRMVLPGDLQALVSVNSPLVFEVDRRTAQIHWELVVDLVPSSAPVSDGVVEPLVVQTSVSRQLRTSYSRAPALEAHTSSGLKVLIIGDPGGEDNSLPGALAEAEAVHRTLKELNLGVEVTALIGAPGKGVDLSAEQPDGAKPRDSYATRLNVLRELLSGGYQIVHYCGHGTFDPDDPSRAGWVFAEGLLTARELAQLGTPPRLVVANACFTSRLGGTAPPPAPGTAAASTGPAPGGVPEGQEANLTPSLADEFFRSGVANYVGAAWKVDDHEAVTFSTTFYGELLRRARPLGEALTAARAAVWKSYPKDTPARDRGTTWAAYQHYGDPTDRLVVDDARSDRGS